MPPESLPAEAAMIPGPMTASSIQSRERGLVVDVSAAVVSMGRAAMRRYPSLSRNSDAAIEDASAVKPM
jgi:hypothetical protein